MFKKSFFSAKIFIITLSIGLFFNYVTSPVPKVIHIYPTPENYKKIQLMDKSKTCFGLKQTEVLCPMDDSDIMKVPYQN
jgi:hypothetical protein|uniref:Uncharacterized protein n=1 Tax=viral metagenome TaxID=1070528 RepID=A0A6C0BX31_9ZZZZ